MLCIYIVSQKIKRLYLMVPMDFWGNFVRQRFLKLGILNYEATASTYTASHSAMQHFLMYFLNFCWLVMKLHWSTFETHQASKVYNLSTIWWEKYMANMKCNTKLETSDKFRSVWGFMQRKHWMEKNISSLKHVYVPEELSVVFLIFIILY